MNNEKHKWTRADTILAFDLYCTIPQREVKPEHPQIISIAKLIGTTAKSLHARLQNFKTYDPSYTIDGKKGLTHGSKRDAEIVAEFLNSPHKLILEAAKIKNELGIAIERDFSQIEIEDIPQGYSREQIIKARVGQGFFRNTVLAAYDNKCCVTGMSVPRLLRASHIKPWSRSDENEKTNPQNGLLLNALFDAAFDTGFITIKENFTVKVSQKLKSNTNDFIKDALLKYADAKIILPQRFLPDKLFLQYHNDIIFQG